MRDGGGANPAYGRANQKHKVWNSRMHISGVLNVEVNLSVLSHGKNNWRYHRFLTADQTSRMLGDEFGSLANPFEFRNFIGTQLCHLIKDSNSCSHHLGANSNILEKWNNRDISFGLRSAVAIS